jgi:hypothetical protein
MLTLRWRPTPSHTRVLKTSRSCSTLMVEKEFSSSESLICDKVYRVPACADNRRSGVGFHDVRKSFRA